MSGVPTDAEILEAIQTEVLDLIRRGWIHPTIQNFGHLHQYCDANQLADHLVSARESSGARFGDFMPPIQDAFTRWLITPETQELVAQNRAEWEARRASKVAAQDGE